MTIPITNLHGSRIIEQIQRNLIQLQLDLVSNAKSHKAMAQVQSPDLATLQRFKNDCVAQYLRRLQWVDDLSAHPEKGARLRLSLSKRGWEENDIMDVVVALKVAVMKLKDAPHSSYEEISTACDVVLNSVSQPDSLWPE